MEALFYAILIGFGIVLLVHSFLLIQLSRQVSALNQSKQQPRGMQQRDGKNDKTEQQRKGTRPSAPVRPPVTGGTQERRVERKGRRDI